MDRQELIRSNTIELLKLQLALSKAHSFYRSAEKSEDSHFRSQTEILKAAWEKAARVFHARYYWLIYPGGADKLSELRLCQRAAIETALDFLEVDPWCFRSGYIKEYIWHYVPQCGLTKNDLVRLRRIALKYLDRRIQREFWFMCRAMTCLGQDDFWELIRNLVRQTHGRKRRRAGFLFSYAQSIEAGEGRRRQLQMQIRSEKFGLHRKY